MTMRGCFAICAIALLAGCSDDDGGAGGSGGSAGSAPDAAPDVTTDANDLDATDADAGTHSDSSADADASNAPCPSDMVLVDAFCIDRYEAPNHAGELPLVMYTFYEAEAWCQARDKRLCFDDEWTRSCEGPAGTTYPYGDDHAPGTCNDDELWRTYDQQKLNGWPLKVASPAIESLAELLDAARAISPSGQVAADHVEWLYQAEPAGQNAGCTGPDQVFDTQGNVEEWTRRRDGGDGPEFSGSLKGRYWAEVRTCQNGVKTHGNAFRFYEIGFRCCRDPLD